MKARNRLILLALAAALLAGCSSPAPLGAPTPRHRAHPRAAASTTTAPASEPFASSFVPESFSAVSVSQWWVLGTESCGAQVCTTIAATSDKGASFQMLPGPGGAFAQHLASSPTVSQVRFADPMDGWAFDPLLYATHDGGHDWTAVPMPGQVVDLEAGLGEVYAVVVPPTPACAKNATCPVTTPGSELWRVAPTSNDWTVDSAAGSVSGGLAVHGRSVWVVNSMPTADGPALGTGLLHSSDGGNHF
jgi:hypothetical protein